jgi:hypothetical protein
MVVLNRKFITKAVILSKRSDSQNLRFFKHVPMRIIGQAN